VCLVPACVLGGGGGEGGAPGATPALLLEKRVGEVGVDVHFNEFLCMARLPLQGGPALR